eukprot:s1099_g25.t2
MRMTIMMIMMMMKEEEDYCWRLSPCCDMGRICRTSAAAPMLQGRRKHAGIGGTLEGLPPTPVWYPYHRPARGMQGFLQAHGALIAAACTARRRIAAGSTRASFAVPLLDLAQCQRSEASTCTPFLDAFRGIGAFQVRVPAPLARDAQRVFKHFETFMALPEAARHRFLCDPGEVLVVHGYQPRGGEGERFNRFRSGIVFHGKSTLPLLPEPFEVDIGRWRDRVWRLSERILEQLRDELCRSSKTEVNLGMGSFSEGAAVDMISGSHFQLKQMHSGSGPGETVRLPLHQDPSFMSLLIHGSSDPPVRRSSSVRLRGRHGFHRPAVSSALWAWGHAICQRSTSSGDSRRRPGEAAPHGCVLLSAAVGHVADSLRGSSKREPRRADFFQRAALAQLPAVRTGSATVEEKGEQMKAKPLCYACERKWVVLLSFIRRLYPDGFAMVAFQAHNVRAWVALGILCSSAADPRRLSDSTECNAPCQPGQFKALPLVALCGGGGCTVEDDILKGKSQLFMQIPVNSSGIRVEMTTRQTDQDLQLVDPSAGICVAGAVGDTCPDGGRPANAGTGCADENDYCVTYEGMNWYFSGDKQLAPVFEKLSLQGRVTQLLDIWVEAPSGGELQVQVRNDPISPCPTQLPGCIPCEQYDRCGPFDKKICDGSAVVVCEATTQTTTTSTQTSVTVTSSTSSSRTSSTTLSHTESWTAKGDNEHSHHYINFRNWYLHCKQHQLNHQLHRHDDAYRNLHEHHDLKEYVRIINKYLGHTN